MDGSNRAAQPISRATTAALGKPRVRQRFAPLPSQAAIYSPVVLSNFRHEPFAVLMLAFEVCPVDGSSGFDLANSASPGDRGTIHHALALCSARNIVHRRIQMGSEFACPHCDSASIVYPDEGAKDRVVCAGCGALLATRSQFRRLIARREKSSEVQTSGC
jgi:hypothetical protein